MLAGILCLVLRLLVTRCHLVDLDLLLVRVYVVRFGLQLHQVLTDGCLVGLHVRALRRIHAFVVDEYAA